MICLGIYEKALPKDYDWRRRFEAAGACGFDYVEMSIDETDQRLSRLDWSREQRLDLVRAKLETGVGLHSICLSGHRRFAFGSQNAANVARARDIMEKAVGLAYDIGVRNIQLAGYDVYPDYEPRSQATEEQFGENLQWAVELAASAQVMLSMEIMDTEFMSTITRWKAYDRLIDSPWFTVYPDIGNVSAWNVDVEKELKLGIDKISAIHLKDTLAVAEGFPGKFKEVPFGTGCVDFVAAFRILKKLNYRGSFMIEQWSEKAKDPLAEVKKTRAWIMERMREANYVD